MNQLTIFNNEEFGTIRAIEKDGEPWFIGKDICQIFGDKNHNRSIGRIDAEDKREEEIVDSMGRKQKAIYVNESGLYSLLFAMQPQKSNKNGVPDAYPIEIKERIEKLKKFKRWVTSEVLPSIRKHGVYMTDSKAYDLLHNEGSLADLLLQAGEQLKQKEIIIRELKPKASYYDTALQSDSLISITAIAKDLGMSGKKLNEILHNLGVQYKKGKMWFLYQDYADKGYTQSKTHLLDAKKSVMSMYWTQKGRQFIYELLKSKLGIMPIVAG